MTEYAAWTTILPDASLKAIAEADRQAERDARAKAKADIDRADHAQDRAIGAYIQAAAQRGEIVTAMDVINGNVGRTFAEITAGATAALADRVPKEMRESLADQGIEVIDVPVRRSRARRGPGGVIDRALLAVERRRVDRPGKEAAAALEAVRAARRRPQADTYADAWRSFRGEW